MEEQKAISDLLQAAIQARAVLITAYHDYKARKDDIATRVIRRRIERLTSAIAKVNGESE